MSKAQWDSSPLLLRDISSAVSCFEEIQKSTINRHAQNTFYKTKHFRILKLTSSNMLASMIFHSFENHFLKEKKLPLFFFVVFFFSATVVAMLAFVICLFWEKLRVSVDPLKSHQSIKQQNCTGFCKATACLEYHEFVCNIFAGVERMYL